MKLRFSKMHGAGNDFVVLDGTREALQLSRAQIKRLGDRRLGVGADQILLVERASRPGVDFAYRIFNGSGDEVEHCGNGARCFLRFVREQGLVSAGQDRVRVQTVNRELELIWQGQGRVTVDMGRPEFDHAALPFDGSGQVPLPEGRFERWPLELPPALGLPPVLVAVLSMGNPHAVLRVEDINRAPVAELGPVIEQHRRFLRKVNAGFMQVVSRHAVHLRVYERDAGETLSCGTGACAAVVAGIRLGWLEPVVDVHTRGGLLRIEWASEQASVLMTGPTETVFQGEIEL
jgi:diaminopimelate epimerase